MASPWWAFSVYDTVVTMNLLAHLFLADPTPESIVGSLLGDFVKGRPDPKYPRQVVAAIKRHRAIDTYTDGHPQIQCSKLLVSPIRRRYAGILVDIFYDYFLCRHWSRFAEPKLEDFIKSAYTGIRAYNGYLPNEIHIVLHRMIQADWLASYQTKAGIARTIERVARRITRENPLPGAIEELKCHQQAFDRHFLKFFPQLMNRFGQPAGPAQY
jgi:acyl carrier protein phosphodiesterase